MSAIKIECQVSADVRSAANALIDAVLADTDDAVRAEYSKDVSGENGFILGSAISYLIDTAIRHDRLQQTTMSLAAAMASSVGTARALGCASRVCIMNNFHRRLEQILAAQDADPSMQIHSPLGSA